MSHHTKLLLALENCSPRGCASLATSAWFRCRCLKMENNLKSPHPPPVSYILLVQGHIYWIIFSTQEHFKPWLLTSSQRYAITITGFRYYVGIFLSVRALFWAAVSYHEHNTKWIHFGDLSMCFASKLHYICIVQGEESNLNSYSEIYF